MSLCRHDDMPSSRNNYTLHFLGCEVTKHFPNNKISASLAEIFVADSILPPFGRVGVGPSLAEYLLGKHRQVDAPVAPDVASVGFHIFIFIALCVPVVAQVHGALIEEIGLAHAHPV